MSLLVAAALFALQSSGPIHDLERVPLERSARVLTEREGRALGIGDWVEAPECSTLAGGRGSWRAAAGEKGTVIALVSVTCPVGQKLFPEIARAEARARELGLGFVHVGVQGLDEPADLAAHVDRHGLEGLALRDTEGQMAAALDARTTTEVFVVDARGTLRYRGAVNDQYGIGFALPEARRRFLDDAMVAVAARGEVAVPATSAPGCAIERDGEAERALPTEVTYARHISRLVQRNCVECHREGGVAPFRLDSFGAVTRRASMLLAVVDDGLMPPWFAARAEGGDPSPWANDRSLLPRERDLLAAWIAAGKPTGDVEDKPFEYVPRADGWTLGEPDVVYELPRAIDVPAEGRVDYQYVSIPTGLEEDRWLRAIEVRPGAVDVVHHVLAYALPADAFRGGRLRRWDLVDERRGFFAAWAPGAEPAVYPDGTARLLPAGTVLLLELHYTPNGEKRSDRTAIGVHFASEDPAWVPERVVRTAGISNRTFTIPPGAGEHGATSLGIATRDLELLSFMPHMHLRGRAFRFEHRSADAAPTTLLDVPRYDFNWQLSYDLVEPLTVRAGDRIDVHAIFDNSKENPANPDPSRPVRWGLETDDEMLIGFVDYVLVEEDLGIPAQEPQFVVLDDAVQTVLRRIAGQSNGVVPRAKLPKGSHASFDRLDRNGDAVLESSELGHLLRPAAPREKSAEGAGER